MKILDVAEIKSEVVKPKYGRWTKEEEDKAKQLLMNHSIQETASILGKSYGSVAAINSRKFHIDKFSDKINHPNLEMSESLAYILGVVKGDGNVSLNGGTSYLVRLEVTSYAFCKSFRDALAEIGFSQYEIKEDVSRSGRKLYRVQAFSKPFGEWYKSLSLDDIWSLIKVDKKLMMAFLRGFYESEGSSRPGEVVIYNTDKNLIDLVGKILENLNYKYYTYNHSNTGWGKNLVYRICIKGGRSERDRFIEELNPCVK